MRRTRFGRDKIVVQHVVGAHVESRRPVQQRVQLPRSFLVAGIFKLLPFEPPLFPRRVDWYRQNRGFKIDKARRELGYEPKVGLDEGLRLAYDWYKQNGYL